MSAGYPATTVGLSRLKTGLGFLLISAMALIIFISDPSRATAWIASTIVTLAVLVTLPSIFDTVPRLIIANDGLSWRDKRKDPLSFLPWSEIVSAEIRDGGEDEPRCLRLKLPRGSILEEVASDRKGGRKIDVPIQGLDISDAHLIGAIRSRAPHLFNPASPRTA